MLPESFLNIMRALLGAEYEAFRFSLSQPPSAALRINPLRKNAFEASQRFTDGRVPWEENGYYIRDGLQPGKSLEHAAGAFYLQDASAMAPVNALDPKPGEIVLDLCAAPGGKSTQIAGRMAGQGVLVANEYVKSRALVLKGNLERMGVANACVTNSPAEAFAALGEVFDAILVDAPCSGEGMFRRDPGAIDEWTPDEPERCAKRQAAILDNAAMCLKPGGRLVYSTCTFNETENEGTVRAFLERHPDFEPVDFCLSGVGTSKNGCVRLWPHKLRGEGHFVCLIRKCGLLKIEVCFVPRQDKRLSALASQLEQLCLKRLPEGWLKLCGDELVLHALLPFELSGINVLSSGLSLAFARDRALEPAHALAMSSAGEEALRNVELDAEQASRFMQGEALDMESASGWTRALYKGLPLGWVKSSDGMLKNHLPKGLRLRGGHALEI